MPGPAGLGSALRGAGVGGDEQIGDAVTVVGQGLAAQALDDDKVACLATQPPEVRGKVIPLRERVCMGQVGDDDVAGLRSGLNSQIGKASCWARVCQFVSYSLVAVSLKNTISLSLFILIYFFS